MSQKEKCEEDNCLKFMLLIFPIVSFNFKPFPLPFSPNPFPTLPSQSLLGTIHILQGFNAFEGMQFPMIKQKQTIIVG